MTMIISMNLSELLLSFLRTKKITVFIYFRRIMKKYLLVFLLALFSILANAQENKPDAASLEVAKATLKAHGGEKLSQAKTMILRGSADVTAPGSPQTLPVAFAIVVAGEKYRFEFQSIILNFQQISDGQNTQTSIAGISLPPLNRVGLFVLPRIEDSGYIVSALPEKLKKKKGFRITSPEGYYSDFVVDEKTSLIKEYHSSFNFNGQMASTSVAIDKYRDVDGILINEKFSQRLDISGSSSYAYFNAKNILINSEVNDDVFLIK